MAAASGGEVVVSSTVHDLVAGSGIEFDDRGLHALKGIPGEWHLYALLRPEALPVAPLDVQRLAAFADQRGRSRRLAAAGVAAAVVVLVVVAAGVVAVLGRGPSGPAIPPGTDTIVALDSSGKAVDVRHVPSGPTALTSDGKNLWVAALDAGVLVALPISGTGSGQTIGRVGRPSGIAAGGDQIWAADAFDQTLTLVDPHSGDTTRTLHMPAPAVGFGAGAAWVVNDIADCSRCRRVPERDCRRQRRRLGHKLGHENGLAHRSVHECGRRAHPLARRTRLNCSGRQRCLGRIALGRLRATHRSRLECRCRHRSRVRPAEHRGRELRGEALPELGQDLVG